VNSYVTVLMGSDSDLPVVQNTLDVLEKLAIPWQVKVTSAHRTPEDTRNFVENAENSGCAVFIAAAGLAAHLAGTVAALTTKPVIGIPISGGALNGFDALLSTVQMPGGVPVACVAIGNAGATNAGWLAAQILALNDPQLAEQLKNAKKSQADAVRAKDTLLQAKIAKD